MTTLVMKTVEILHKRFFFQAVNTFYFYLCLLVNGLFSFFQLSNYCKFIPNYGNDH